MENKNITPVAEAIVETEEIIETEPAQELLGEAAPVRGNVLVIGESGVGKSTLINAILGRKEARTGHDPEGTTKHLTTYDSDIIPFRLLDTMGFEPSLKGGLKAIYDVRKWSRESAKAGNINNSVNVIWFCVSGTERKLFAKSIKALSTATAMWKDVPVIVVITKSFSEPDREENVEMVRKAFAEHKRYDDNLRAIIPVVAETYTISEGVFAPPMGITELIEVTNDLMPEGIKAAKKVVADVKLNRLRALAHGLVATATTAGVVVATVSLPVTDGVILTSIEAVMVSALAKMYGIDDNADSKTFIQSIVKVGTVSAVARAVISAIRAIPGINIGATVLNAVIAGSFVAAIGEGSILAFEQIYLGNKSITDSEWAEKAMEMVLSQQFISKVEKVTQRLSSDSDNESIVKVILDIFKNDDKKLKKS